MDKPSIGVIGAGVVGMATAGMLNRFGYEVSIWDIDKDLRRKLRKNGWNVSKKSVNNANIVFICTGEKAVPEVLEEFAHFWKRKKNSTLAVVRSTVPPGTCKWLMGDTGVHVSHNPEFLREAVANFEVMNPRRIIIGECCEAHGDVLEEIYAPFSVKTVRIDQTTSEMVKLATNAYLSTSISFWNEVKHLCDNFSINSHRVGVIAALDHRISSYGAHMHGQPFISTCLNKDLDTLIFLMDTWSPPPRLLSAVKDVNFFAAQTSGVDVEEAIRRLRKK